MFKKISIIMAVILLLGTMNVFAVDTYGGYNVPIDIDINGSLIKCEQKPILIDGTTYLPLRAFSDAIGAAIEWDAENGVATILKDGHAIEFYPGKSYCLMDGEKANHPSVIYHDLTFIPVRAVSELLCYHVVWDDVYLSVRITAPDVTVPGACKDTSYSYEDIMYLAKITQIESGYQPFDVKLGVAGTVMNRVKSSQFPNCVKDVIFDTKYGVQFPPVHTDKINVTPSSESIMAAKCALNGANNVGNSLYFIDTKSAAKSWAHNNRPYYATIDDMNFYE